MLGAVRGCRGIRGLLEAGWECRYSGDRRGIGGKRGHWGLIWVLGPLGGIRGVRGYRGVRDALGWQVDWELNHIGPQSRVPALPLVLLGGVTYLTKTRQGPLLRVPSLLLVSLGEWPYLVKAMQVTNELCRLLYTFGTIFHNSLHVCVNTTSSHVLTHNVKKCYTDYFLCRPIYTSPYTINLTNYDTMVLIMKNCFSHQTSELGTSYCKYQADLM